MKRFIFSFLLISSLAILSFGLKHQDISKKPKEPTDPTVCLPSIC